MRNEGGMYALVRFMCCLVQTYAIVSTARAERVWEDRGRGDGMFSVVASISRGDKYLLFKDSGNGLTT